MIKLIVNEVYATEFMVICPNPECGAEMSGWDGKPSGEDTCENCGCEYEINSEADIESL